METNRASKQNLIIQGSILVITSIIVRLIGFFYRVPLDRILGDEGSGYYVVAFQAYTLFLMLSSYGFAPAIAKINSSLLAQKKYRESHELAKSAIILGTCVGLFFSVILWAAAPMLSKIYHEPNIVWGLRSLTIALFCFSILAVLRGYFQGFNTMVPTAISQIIEQVFNAAFSIIMAQVLIGKGKEFGAAGGTLGTGIGAFVGLGFMVFVYYGARKTVIKRWYINPTDSYEAKSIVHYSKLILFISIPLITGTAINTFAGLVDMTMLNRSLLYNGFAEKIAREYIGLYGMKYLLLINLPIIAISSSMSSSLIPSVSSSLAVNDLKAVNDKVRGTFKISLIALIPASIGMAVFSYPIIDFIFETPHIITAAKMLKIGAITIVLVGVNNILAATLIGINKLKIQVITSAIAFLAKVVFNYILLYIVKMDIYGLIVSNILYGVFMMGIKSYVVYRYIGLVIDLKRSIVLPFVSAVIMGALGYLIYYLVSFTFIPSSLALFIAVGCSMAIYGIMIVRLGSIKENEIYGMPKGKQIVSVLKRFKVLQ